jgi:hypothetical protein
MFECHPEVVLGMDAAQRDHPRSTVGWRCLHCDVVFSEIAVYTAHLAVDHKGKSSI